MPVSVWGPLGRRQSWYGPGTESVPRLDCDRPRNRSSVTRATHGPSPKEGPCDSPRLRLSSAPFPRRSRDPPVRRLKSVGPSFSFGDRPEGRPQPPVRPLLVSGRGPSWVGDLLLSYKSKNDDGETFGVSRDGRVPFFVPSP